LHIGQINDANTVKPGYYPRTLSGIKDQLLASLFVPIAVGMSMQS
jgi:hypothetical protein